MPYIILLDQGIPEASIEWRYPTKELPEADKQVMGMINEFCFPDASKFPKVKISNKNKKFSFVVTSVDNVKRFGYCRRHLVGDFNLSNKGRRYAICHCILSQLPCHALFDSILEVANSLSKEALMVLLYKLYRQKIPQPGHSISVTIPGQVENQEYVFTRPEDDQSLSGFGSFTTLLEQLDPFSIVTVIISMLCERRIIFLSRKLSVLSNCVQACVALISPFVWQHVFIPVLPLKMITFVCAPVPFLVGVLELHLNKIYEQSHAMEEVMMVDLDRSNITPPSEDFKKLDDEYILPFLYQIQNAKAIIEESNKSRHSYKNLLKRGSQGRNKSNDSDTNQETVKNMLVTGFINFISTVAGHYKKYVRNDHFDKDGFVKEIPNLEGFLKLLSSSQLFDQFVTDKSNEKSFEIRKRTSGLSNSIPFNKENVIIREGFLNKFRRGGIFVTFSSSSDKGYFQNRYIKLYCDKIVVQKSKNNDSEMIIELKNIEHTKLTEYQGYINCLEIKIQDDYVYLQSNDEANIQVWHDLIKWRLELIFSNDKRYTSMHKRNSVSNIRPQDNNNRNTARISMHRTMSEIIPPKLTNISDKPPLPPRDSKPPLNVPKKRPLPKVPGAKKTRPLPTSPKKDNSKSRPLPKIPPK